ncbi:UNVERIFIED_CONTAM: hypothetical protein PYX00_006401 [Menopon gallinae]|uniref:Uncharacterized protein n=1 Tax=Menopon gallinae TaxID=328185 RepID=A0AAW2HX34_9NEOP
MRTSTAALVCATLVTIFVIAESKPTIYMKNENDKLEPLLLPVSSTVIPIPVGHYQVRAGVGLKSNGKYKKQKVKLTKPDGPIKLITLSGLKKMAAEESKSN